MVVGPQSVFLEYDETMEALQLSTGTPKSDEGALRTAYLRVLNNKVSDVIEAETKDLCHVSLSLSYRVNFEGEPERWFQVENYVKFLCDHLRSILRATIKQMGLEEFYSKAIEVVRNAILGGPQERRGRTFAENGMRVYDVDVLDVKIGDESIGQMLTEAQHQAVRQAITLADEQRQLETTRRSEEIRQEIETLRFATVRTQLEIKRQEVNATLEVDQARLNAQILQESQKLKADQEKQATLDALQASQLARQSKQQDQELRYTQAQLEQRLAELRGDVDATVQKAGAVSPELVAALQSFSDQHLAGKLAESMSPLAILGGKSVTEVFSQLVKGSPLANAVEKWGQNGPAAARADGKN